MPNRFAVIGAAVLACAAPAAATDWASVDGWDIYEVDRSRCVVGRVFAQSAATFGIIMSLDGEVRVFATGPGWPTRAGERIDAAVGLDEDVLIAGSAVGIAQGQNKGFVTAASSVFLARFASARQLMVRPGPVARQERITLTGGAAGLAQARRCLDNLRAEGRLSPAPMASYNRATPAPAVRAPARQAVAAAGVPVARPVARGSRASWISNEDYPDAALRAEQQGAVTVKLAINEAGSVAGCEILKSSGSSALDGTTCRMIQRRARYTPARDASGRAVPGLDQHTVRWTLPE